MSAPRTLRFDTEKEVIAEIGRLRVGYGKTGKWTLAQICWHVGLPIEKHLNPPEPMDLQPTPEQEAKKKGFVDYIVTHRSAPPGVREAPPQFIPPDTAGEADVDRYIALLDKMAKYPHPKVMMGPVGPVTIQEFRLCNVFHAAHHLAFLLPTNSRRELQFSNTSELKSDIQKLRKTPHKQLGNWSLAKTCWHLETAIRLRMVPGPFPPNTPEQNATRPRLEEILSSGQLPSGIQAPDPAVPPADAADASIDTLLATIDRFDSYKEPFAPHRIFGNLTDAEVRKLNLIHCAHHLSYLVPQS
ncbi:MAG TPA: DUF1569 domain-containing protein [Tepidisphaeraceae bacterium]|jgi:hypothetical protein|nr:DUF1569 domain-containing protein [Tepidisphaeraceae bacterium]